VRVRVFYPRHTPGNPVWDYGMIIQYHGVDYVLTYMCRKAGYSNDCNMQSHPLGHCGKECRILMELLLRFFTELGSKLGDSL